MRIERLDPFTREQLDGAFGSRDVDALRLTWIGDSTGDGVGASAADNALPRLVAKGLRRPVELTVLARSGSRVTDALEEQLPLLAETTADWVVVAIGNNDVTHATSRKKLRSQLAELLAGVQAVKPQRIIVLGTAEFAGTPLLAQPLRFFAGLRSDQLNRDIRAAAREVGATFVDIIDGTGGAFVKNPKQLHARDGFHPNDAGYALWAETILKAI